MIFFLGISLLLAAANAQSPATTWAATTRVATSAPLPSTTRVVTSAPVPTTAPWASTSPPFESCLSPPNAIYSPCSSNDDRVRWVNSATRAANPNSFMMSTSGGVFLVIGTVKSVVADGQSYRRVVLDDAWSVDRGVVAPEMRPIFAYGCNSAWLFSRNFNTTTNINARFPVGRKLLMFVQQDYSFNGTANLIVSPCEGETAAPCLDASNPQCQTGFVRQQLIVAASSNPQLARLLSADAAGTCAPACKNGGQCKLGVCVCPFAFMGAQCETARPPPPAVTVTTTRIVPGAGSNGSDVWVSGTKRKIQIPIVSADRSIPTGFARVMLLNLNPSSYCRNVLPNATVDGLPAWYFADSSEVDPTTSPRYLTTELLAVVDLSKLQWVAGSKAKATIQIEQTLTLAQNCKDAGVGYRIAVMLSANRGDDAALAGPFTGGQFAIAIGGCIGDGVAGVCKSNVGGGAAACVAGGDQYMPLRVAAKSVTSGQCVGADSVCCIPDRTNLVAAPISQYAFMALDMPKSQLTVEGPPSSSFAWGETVKLTWTVNRQRPQPSPFSLFFPDGFCAIDEGLDAASNSFELLLVAVGGMMFNSNDTNGRSLGKVKLSAGKFDAPLELPQNWYTPYQMQFVAKFSETCKYTSAPFQVRESPCFSTASKTLIGTCKASCNSWGEESNVIGSCTGLTYASKCCGRIRNSNDGFRFADEGDDIPSPEGDDTASASGGSAIAALVAAMSMVVAAF
jgi:hypothetical protein